MFYANQNGKTPRNAESVSWGRKVPIAIFISAVEVFQGEMNFFLLKSKMKKGSSFSCSTFNVNYVNDGCNEQLCSSQKYLIKTEQNRKSKTIRK